MRTPIHKPEAWEVSNVFDPNNPAAGAISYYVNSLLALRNNFGRSVAGLDIDAEDAAREWEHFLVALSNEGRKSALEESVTDRRLFSTPPVKQLAYLQKVARHHESAHLSIAVSHAWFLQLVAEYDSYVGKLLRAVFEMQPALLARSNATLKWEDIADLENLEGVRKLVIEREVEGLLRQGHVEQLSELERRLGVATLREFQELGQFVEIMQRRNLVAHTGSKVSIQYVRACEKYNSKRVLRYGELAVIDDDYFRASAEDLLVVGVKLGQVLWRAILGKDRRRHVEPDNHLAYVTYSLMVHQEWGLAERLLAFATGLKVVSTDQRRYVFVVNHAQTLKWQGRQDNCLEVLDGVEWESLDIAFQLAAAVLRDDFDSAGHLMRTAASTGQIPRTSFESWPLYREFRKTDQYRRVFEEVFLVRPTPAVAS